MIQAFVPRMDKEFRFDCPACDGKCDLRIERLWPRTAPLIKQFKNGLEGKGAMPKMPNMPSLPGMPGSDTGSAKDGGVGGILNGLIGHTNASWMLGGWVDMANC